MKIGIVDLDTSHPAAWIPIERELGHEIVGVWDGGSVHPPAYVRQFAAEHGIPRVFASLAAMAGEVDCAVIHGCDWDTHVAKARPFLEARRAVLLDKPLAGSPGDLAILAEWSRQGARLAGGSSLRFCREVREWLAVPAATRGTPHTAFTLCGVDEFSYGVHACSLLCGIMGPGIREARHLQSGPAERMELRWADGRVGFVCAATEGLWLPFQVTVATEKTAAHLVPDTGRLYRALLETCLPYLAGATAAPPVPSQAWLEPELALIAVRESRRQGGRPVALSALAGVEGYDGAGYAARYRDARHAPPLRTGDKI